MDRRSFLGRLCRAVVAAPILAFAGSELLRPVAIKLRERKPFWRNFTETYTPMSEREFAARFRQAMQEHEFVPPVDGIRFDEGHGKPNRLRGRD